MDLIINADDLGLSREINQSIFDAIDRGFVTSASILANGPYVDEACRHIPLFPQCSFGAHLNITEFRPISRNARLAPILNSQGAFTGEQIRSIPITRSLSEGIYAEFCAQIQKLSDYGVYQTHLDSHQYIMTIPKMLFVARRLQKKFGIKRMRLTRNVYEPGETVSKTMRLKKYLYNFLLQHYVGAKTTKGFGSFQIFHTSGMNSKTRHPTFEAVVHPGNPYYPKSEMDLLMGNWQDQLNFPIRLINDTQIT